MQKFLSRFRKDQNGSATVEFVIWLPLIASLIVGAFDLNVVLLTQSNMWNVARDAARRVAIGDMDSDAAETWAEAQLAMLGMTPTVTVSQASDDITVAVSASVADMAILGSLTQTKNYTINASVTMRSEQ